nr:fibrous sheath CABYR-binding protein-like [Aegilops tauschii subsp. strangulata]
MEEDEENFGAGGFPSALDVGGEGTSASQPGTDRLSADREDLDTVIEDIAKSTVVEAEKIAAEENARGAAEDAAEGPAGELGKATAEEAGKGPAGGTDKAAAEEEDTLNSALTEAQGTAVSRAGELSEANNAIKDLRLKLEGLEKMLSEARAREGTLTKDVEAEKLQQRNEAASHKDFVNESSHLELLDAGQILRPGDLGPRQTSFLCAKSARHAPFRLGLDREEQAALLPSSAPPARHLAGERPPRPDPRALSFRPCRRVPPASSSSLHQAAPPRQVPCIAPPPAIVSLENERAPASSSLPCFRSPSPASADASEAPQVAVSLLPSSFSSRVLPLHVLSLSLSHGQENPVARMHRSHLLPSPGSGAPSPVLAGLSSRRAPAKPASCRQAPPLPDAPAASTCCLTLPLLRSTGCSRSPR